MSRSFNTLCIKCVSSLLCNVLSLCMVPGLLGSLEVTKQSNEATILDLQTALAKLQDKISWLETERSSLESNQESMSQEQNKHLKSLEKVRSVAK